MRSKKMKKHDKTFPPLFRSIKPEPELARAKKTLEKKTFCAMAALYCRAEKHASCLSLADVAGDPEVEAWIRGSGRLSRTPICEACKAMIEDVFRHSERCPHSLYKTFCHECPTPWYSPQKLEAIVPVMHYAGPRLIFSHPLLSFEFIRNLRAAKKFIRQHQEKENIK